MKKRLFMSLGLSTLLFGTALMASEANPTEIFGNMHKIPLDKIKLVNTKTIEEYGMKQYILSVDGYPIKGVLHETNNGLYIPGNIYTVNGQNFYQDAFQEVNKEYLEKQAEAENAKANAEKEARKAAMIKKAPQVASFIKEIEGGKYGDLVRTVIGNPEATEQTMYLFTDPLCPFCQQYEKGMINGEVIPGYGLEADLTKYKEIKIVMLPLYMLNGHATSPQRSLWFNENFGMAKTQIEQLNVLRKASYGNINDLVVDEEKFKVYDSMVKDQTNGILSSRVINGTPSMFTPDGMDPRLK